MLLHVEIVRISRQIQIPPTPRSYLADHVPSEYFSSHPSSAGVISPPLSARSSSFRNDEPNGLIQRTLDAVVAAAPLSFGSSCASRIPLAIVLAMVTAAVATAVTDRSDRRSGLHPRWGARDAGLVQGVDAGDRWRGR